MTLKNIWDQLNVKKQCDKYGVPLWQCPQFLFVIMGFVIMIIIIISYLIASKQIEDPQTVALLVLFLTLILTIIDYVIIQSFEKMAELTKAKMDFVGIITHQLRSPVTNLKYSVEVLNSEDMAVKEKKEYYRILKENIERMSDLIDDILAVSRLSVGALKLTKKEFSLKKLLDEVLEEFQTTMRSSNIKLSLDVAADLPTMRSDSFWIKEAIKNLVDNAVRYKKEDKGSIKITLKKKGSSIYFEIKDTGIGIPKEAQKHVFEKFYRGRNVIKYQTEGTGLGLYIVRETIRQLGGKVDFQSQENEGATFWFTLPIKPK